MDHLGKTFRKEPVDSYAIFDRVPLLMLNQWAMLICGYAPFCGPDADPMDIGQDVYAVFKELKTAVHDGRLPLDEGMDPAQVNRSTQVRRRAVRDYYETVGQQIDRPKAIYPENRLQRPIQRAYFSGFVLPTDRSDADLDSMEHAR